MAKKRMSSIHNKRRRYMLDHSPVSRILDERDYGDCSEFFTDAYGDANVYRVYGTSESNFKMYVR